MDILTDLVVLFALPHEPVNYYHVAEPLVTNTKYHLEIASTTSYAMHYFCIHLHESDVKDAGNCD